MMNALARLPVSTLCDVDKSLPVVDPAIRPITASARLCGPAYTAVAADEFVSTLWAINDAAPGDVLVVQTGGSRLAALGELLAAEAYRRRLGESSSTVTCATAAVYRRSYRCGLAARCLTRGDRERGPNVGGQISFGGLPVTPGDIVVADDDGIVIAPRTARGVPGPGRANRADRGRHTCRNPGRHFTDRDDQPRRPRGGITRWRPEQIVDYTA